jgi:two-component system chemotaxis sensor kinase CheA
MVDLVGELVTVQARLTQKAAGQNDPDLLLIAEEVERLSAELRDNTMSVRMLPIGSTFATFNRLVRDLTNELGKEVDLTTAGSDTELDKTVIEQLKDPLVHIIRNSIDHGVEMPAERVAAGKPRCGTVHLSAAHSGASVLITISDDGAGLDREAIYRKAVERGIIAPDAQLGEPEIFNLIFEPGFSTAKTVTGVSGRGVGMDVVKRSIEALRGAIVIKSERGAGTSITLKLPLTLAIIDGLMVKIGDGAFVLPLSAVEECVELSCEEVDVARKRGIINIRGEVVPYFRLRELFHVSGEAGEIEQVVVAEAGGARIALGVDCVIGQHQTVIKSLGKMYQGVKGTSGATILGDGSVALIIDLLELVSLSEKENRGVA